MAFIGDTVLLTFKFRNWDGDLTDPSTMTARFYDHKRNQIGGDVTLGVEEKVSTGIYHLEYTIPSTTSPQIIYEVLGIVEGSPAVKRGPIPIRWG